MTDQDIITYFSKFETPRKINWKKLPEDIAFYLANRYIDNSTDTLKESYARILYNIEIIPVCPTCGKPLTFINRLDCYPFPKHCSNKCKANNPDWLSKQRSTKLKRYGDANYNNRDKFKDTCVDKFGTENPFQSENIKNKIKEVKLEMHV